MNSLLNFPVKTDLASLILRLSIGGMFLLHGIGKVLVVGMETVNQNFMENGFPIWTNYFATFTEIIGGILLLIGFHSRLAALMLLPICLGIVAFHFPNGWVHSSPGGGWEYPQLILVSTLIILFLGDGKYSLSGKIGSNFSSI